MDNKYKGNKIQLFLKNKLVAEGIITSSKEAYFDRKEDCIYKKSCRYEDCYYWFQFEIDLNDKSQIKVRYDSIRIDGGRKWIIDEKEQDVFRGTISIDSGVIEYVD